MEAQPAASRDPQMPQSASFVHLPRKTCTTSSGSAKLPDDAQVGWFLHTPFPSSEIYRALPVREEVLKAVLKSDLIGFHTYDYARHFVSACTRILGLEVCPLTLDVSMMIC